MSDFIARIRQWREALQERWNKFSLNQKVLMTGAVMLCLISVGMLLSSQMGVDYEPLYTRLSVDDAAAITEKLDAAKIKYKLEDEGSTILVPAAQKYRVRLMLAGEGLPRGVAGLELFQKPQFGETETDKRIKYLTGLQGELIRTIETLDKIETARVHLVIPEPSLYASQEQPPTASVMVKVKAGYEMTKKELQGIINLVANSVEGLKTENVAVIDQHSNLLSADLPGAEGLNTVEMSAQQLVIKRQFEREKQLAIQSMLDAILGSGKSLVRVNAELNFDEVEQFEQNWDPDKRVVLSRHTLEESSSSTIPGTNPPVGTESNIPYDPTTYQGEDEEAGSSTYDKSEKTVNYEGDKLETRIRVAPGAVERLTVAVMVDEDFIDKQEDIHEAVENASGVDMNRNDSVSVNFMQFQLPEEPAVPAAGAADGLIKYAVPLGLAVIFLLGLIGLYWFRTRQEAEEIDLLVDEEIDMESLVEKELTPEEKEKRKIREEIDKLVQQNPEDAAQLIRTWMLEDTR